MPEQPRYYINDTGTGNTLNLSHMRVIKMVTDSLRYWVTETHVDGFRFDLGTILAREPNGFDDQSGFLKACCQDPVLDTAKLIAEPWDCGPGGYQVGGQIRVLGLDQGGDPGHQRAGRAGAADPPVLSVPALGRDGHPRRGQLDGQVVAGEARG